MPNQIKLFVVAGLILLVLIVILQNTEVVAVKLLFWEFQMSRVILILLASIAGFIAGYLVGRIGRSSAPAP